MLDENLQALQRFDRFVNRPPAWLPPEVQVQICRELVFAYLRRCEKSLPCGNFLFSNYRIERCDDFDKLVTAAMGPFYNQGHLRGNAIQAVLEHVSLEQNTRFIPEELFLDARIPGYQSHPIVSDYSKSHDKYAKDLSLYLHNGYDGTISDTTLEFVLDGLHERLESLRAPAAYPQLDSLTVILHGPFDWVQGSPLLSKEWVLQAVVETLKRLNIRRRRIIYRGVDEDVEDLSIWDTGAGYEMGANTVKEVMDLLMSGDGEWAIWV